jgi:hypothetical protein
MRDARVAALAGRTAASCSRGERPVRADHDNDEIENWSDCCAMQISTRRANSVEKLCLIACPFADSIVLSNGGNFDVRTKARGAGRVVLRVLD